MEQINIIELLLILRKRFWFIAVFVVTFAVISGLISFFIVEPEYQTYTTLVIGRIGDYKEKVEYEDVLLNQKLVSTYGEIAKSKMVARELISNLGLSYTDEELDKKIEVAIIKSTEIIKITVKDKDGGVAARIADELARVFIKNIVNVMKIRNIQVVDKAVVPLKPYKPKPVINMAIASVLGSMLGIISVFAYENFDNTIKTTDDIEKNLGLPIIGIIPKIT
ncbi:YveK family protein [Lutispora saccharofermentans]|jgi:capsular polysaccharide biosynthesis protein|uniref:Lipopolysaccharide biosynthesis protein n=1 Tax=Lutispora saccharofermentans TaxID=3024236 RepID=A0ABT1ND53_9FIRM|nr:Wzz/FepE/Etk N-terminal domain-containing protein [Lutispora saccharofermentans]MCQ1528261.1 lipopolysaccharide biosynthesis protein [Lutispora saccharofermentans]